jgi:penicillin-binding protein 1A
MNEEYISEKINSWYIDMVIDDVCADLCDKYGYSYAEASSMVYGGGLRIYTLMDADIQKIIEEYYADESNFPEGANSQRAQTSMIIIDPYTGDVLGVAGARGQKNANRIQNYATDTVRPSGSVIKPLSIYAPALEDGVITYASVFDDVPVNFGEYNMDASKGEIVYPSPWPGNAPAVYHGLVNVNYAVEVSLNTVPIKILDLIGKERSFYFLKDELGFYNLIESMTLESGAVLTDMDTAALALGQMNYGVTVREVTAAYSIFVNEGVYSKPRSYSLVTDSFGNVILDNKREKKQVISADNAYIMNQMLMNVVDFGTASGISLDAYTSVAGKTGTSQDYYDRWFIGYTPCYLGGVWYGYEYPKSLESNTKHICTEIWDDIMSEIYKGREEELGETFFHSGNIIKVRYCKDSGKLMTVACRADPRGDRSEMGYFVKGSEPTERCDCHILVKYDKINGGVGYGTCPVSDETYVGLIQVERHFPIQVYVSDAQYVWRKLPKDIMPGDDDDEPFFINTLEKGDFCGISYSAVQYNRSCKSHFNYLEWLLGRKKQE